MQQPEDTSVTAPDVPFDAVVDTAASDSPASVSPELPVLDEAARALLSGECDRMLSLYHAAQSGAQSVFNFYLTFVTAVIAGLIFLAGDVGAAPAALAGVLLFAALVGSVYLSALAGRYGHAARYARAADLMRHALLSAVRPHLPPDYAAYLAADPDQQERVSPLAWFVPQGTYTMFVAFINSAALGGMVAIIAAEAGAAAGRGLLAAALVFVFALTVHNVYVRLVIRRLRARFGVRVDLGDDMALWASRE